MYLNLKKKNSFLFDQKAFLTVCERFGSSVMNRKYAINAKKQSNHKRFRNVLMGGSKSEEKNVKFTNDLELCLIEIYKIYFFLICFFIFNKRF